MTNNRRLSNEELAQIKERAEKANNGNYLLSPEVISYLYDSVDDVPKLLAEVERLNESLAMCKKINSGLHRELALANGEKPVKVHLNNGGDSE